MEKTFSKGIDVSGGARSLKTRMSALRGDSRLDKARLLSALDRFLAKMDAAWSRYHRIADQVAPQVREEFLRGVAKTQKAIDTGALEKALQAGDLAGAENLIDWTALDQSLEEINRLLGMVFQEAADVAGKTLLKDLGIRKAKLEDVAIAPTLVLPNIEAEKWMTANAARLVVEVGEETKSAIRELVLRGQREGVAPRKTARDIREFIGLTDRETMAVVNFRGRLEAQARFSAEQIDKKTERYYRHKLKERSERVAREETIRASKEGTDSIMRQAIGEGYLTTEGFQRRWLTTPDDRACELCLDMDGEVVGLEEPYSSGDMIPHLHTTCRCAEAVEPKVQGETE